MREVIYFDEDQTVGCYSRSKAIASQAVLDAANIEGVNACIVHPSGILGPEDPAIGDTTGTVIDIIKGEMPIIKIAFRKRKFWTFSFFTLYIEKNIPIDKK